MIYTQTITTDIKITKLQDLKKLASFLTGGLMKINKSKIARELGVDRRTVAKYLDGFEKSKTKKKKSKIDDFYDEIHFLLIEQQQQVFHYKRILWQFLMDNKGLRCAESSFHRYIQKHPEFDAYFKGGEKKSGNSKPAMRFETEAGKQAQIDWKESLKITLKTGEMVEINIFVFLLSYSRFRIYRVSLSRSQDLLFSFLDLVSQKF